MKGVKYMPLYDQPICHSLASEREREQERLVPRMASPLLWDARWKRLCSLSCPPASNGAQRRSYDNFFRMLRMSPTASSVLVVDEDQLVRTFALDSTHYSRNRFYMTRGEIVALSQEQQHEQEQVWEPQSTFAAGDAVYDAQWAPSTASPGESLYLLASKDHPIHLIDTAYPSEPHSLGSGLSSSAARHVSSFVYHNHLDELDTTYSLAFSTACPQRFFAGATRKITVFDLQCPSNGPIASIPTATTRSATNGQRGILSCLASQPHGQGLLAAGSFGDNAIALYCERSARNATPSGVLSTDKAPVMGQQGDDQSDVFSALPLSFGKDRDRQRDTATSRSHSHSQQGSASVLYPVREVALCAEGVSSLEWSSCGRYLWATCRRDSSIRCFDSRMSDRAVFAVDRPWSLSLRAGVSTDAWHSSLLSGDDSGRIHVFDIATGLRRQCIGHDDGLPCEDTESVDNRRKGPAVSAVAMHPFASLAVTVSGHRQFHDEDSQSDSDSDHSSGGDCHCDENRESKDSVSGNVRKRRRNESDGYSGQSQQHDRPPRPTHSELVLWALPSDRISFESVYGQDTAETVSTPAQDESGSAE